LTLPSGICFPRGHGAAKSLTRLPFCLMLQPLAADARIAIVSPSGWGNLGDAAIIESLVAGIRRRLPKSEVIAFTLNAAGTTEQHGIPAHTLLGYSIPFYPMNMNGRAKEGEAQGPTAAPSAWQKTVSTLHAALQRAPLPGAVRDIVIAPARIAREAAHIRRSLRFLGGASAVVVAGGGQLDELFGGPWGHPWALLRYALLARATHAPFYVASVGTGTLASRSSRFLVRRALALARYRSFRDDRSRELVGAPGITGNDPTVPDLAYGVPVTAAPLPGRDRLVVGLSPMNFGLPAHWPRQDASRYRRHVTSFGKLAARLLEEGQEVVIFTTDGDSLAVQHTVEAIGELPQAARARLRVSPTPTLAELFPVLSGVDLVVAARLHGVLLAHVAHRPVLAVSHERKVATLMEEMGQSHFCMTIDEFDGERGYDRLQELAGRRRELSGEIARAVEQRRQRVFAQYDALFGPVPA